MYEDQLLCADLVVLNKTDLLTEQACDDVARAIASKVPRAVKILRVAEGRVAPSALLGLASAAEDDLDGRPSHHDGDADHEHDDFESFVFKVPEIAAPEPLLAVLGSLSATHGILRVKGFVAVASRPMRLAVQGVGSRFRQQFDRPWGKDEPRGGHLVMIGQRGLDRDAIAGALACLDPQPA